MSRGQVAILPTAVPLLGFVVHSRLLTPPTRRWPALMWPSIGQIQRAGTGPRMVRIMTQLGTEGRGQLGKALWCDLLIIAGYLTLLLSGVAWSEGIVQSDLSGDQVTAGLGLAHMAVVATWAAGVLDLVENMSLAVALHTWRDLDQLNGTNLEEARRAAAVRERWPARIAHHATDVKWVLLAFVVLWLAVASLVALAP